MVQGDSEREVDTHNPVFGRARKVAVQNVGDHTEDPVDVKAHHRTDGERDISDSEEGKVTVLEQDENAGDEGQSPCDDKRDVKDAESVQVRPRSHIVAIGKDHDGDRWESRSDKER